LTVHLDKIQSVPGDEERVVKQQDINETTLTAYGFFYYQRNEKAGNYFHHFGIFGI